MPGMETVQRQSAHYGNFNGVMIMIRPGKILLLFLTFPAFAVEAPLFPTSELSSCPNLKKLKYDSLIRKEV